MSNGKHNPAFEGRADQLTSETPACHGPWARMSTTKYGIHDKLEITPCEYR